MSGEPRWRHNDDERRWELAAPGASVSLGYVTDEFLADVALSQAELDQLIEDQFGVPLPIPRRCTAYFCPASGTFECCGEHSGYDVCCDQPERHLPLGGGVDA